jgi:hypothetical protein
MKTAAIPGVMFLVCLSAAGAEPYVGLDSNRYSLTLSNSASQLTPQSAAGEDIHIGDRFGNLAGELGYGTSTSYSNLSLDNLHLTRLTADGIFYLPVAGGLNILLTAGGARTNYGISTYARNYYQLDNKTKSNNADAPVISGDELNWRAGAGLSFGLDEFELRTLVRYQPLSLQGQAQNALSLDFGINFYF